jgi:predicted dehydrogenase/nucleoside-diphosphate-sugar epimerase
MSATLLYPPPVVQGSNVEARPMQPVQQATADSPLRIAIIGCGAITEKLHLPALMKTSGVRVTALVDPDTRRLPALAARIGGDVHTAASTENLERHADAAVIAVPNHLHMPIAADLLQRGLHVLVEKPLTVSLEEAQRLIEIATRAGKILSVALIRRHYLSFEYVQKILQAGWIGRVLSFDCREGMAYAWSTASSSLYRREHGGGVLVDRGAHALDMLLSWLGPYRSVMYWDDARGGVEANSRLDLELESGARGVIELSWTRDLRNTCVIRGEKGEIEVGMFPGNPVRLRVGTIDVAGLPQQENVDASDLPAVDARQFAAFAEAIRMNRPSVAAEDSLESIRLFEDCYKDRQALALPWDSFEGEVDWAKFDGKRVLVIGGTGFLGGRVVEALKQHSNADVRVLARSFARMANVARYPVDVVRGDVCDPDALRLAMRDCDYVINCAYGKGARDEQVRVNMEATKHIVRIARECGVRQLVHTSTLMVYGDVTDGVLTEAATTRAPRRHDYGYTKWQGEEIALREANRVGLPVAVIQPAAVYGPDSPPWTWLPINTMKSGRIVLVNGGNGISNAVYVDDVVAAMLNAAVEPRAAGERMLISGPDVVTWREFYAAFDELLGGGRTVSMRVDEIAKARRERKGTNLGQLLAIIREEHSARQRLLGLPAIAPLRRAFETFMPSAFSGLKGRLVKPSDEPTARVVAAPANNDILLPTPEQERFFRAIAPINCAKAAQLIGYRPRYSFERGMRLVSAWAKWANAV